MRDTNGEEIEECPICGKHLGEDEIDYCESCRNVEETCDYFDGSQLTDIFCLKPAKWEITRDTFVFLSCDDHLADISKGSSKVEPYEE